MNPAFDYTESSDAFRASFKAWRNQCNLSQQDLYDWAKCTETPGINNAQISNLESGKLKNTEFTFFLALEALNRFILSEDTSALDGYPVAAKIKDAIPYYTVHGTVADAMDLIAMWIGRQPVNTIYSCKALTKKRQATEEPRKESSKKLQLVTINETEASPNKKARSVLNGAIRKALARNSTSSKTIEKYCGCTQHELRLYLQDTAPADFNWLSFHDYDLDHIRQCHHFDLTNHDAIKDCYHYSNLRLLLTEEHVKRQHHEGAA